MSFIWHAMSHSVRAFRSERRGEPRQRDFKSDYCHYSLIPRSRLCKCACLSMRLKSLNSLLIYFVHIYEMSQQAGQSMRNCLHCLSGRTRCGRSHAPSKPQPFGILFYSTYGALAIFINVRVLPSKCVNPNLKFFVPCLSSRRCVR